MVIKNDRKYIKRNVRGQFLICYFSSRYSPANSNDKEEVIMNTAYWDWRNNGTHFCSNCGHNALYNCEHQEICSNFCYHCGKLMIDIEFPNMDWVPCTECISFDECENKENCDGCYAGEREEE